MFTGTVKPCRVSRLTTWPNVRVVMQNGEPWWVLKDVCDVLELQSFNVKSRLDLQDLGSTKVLAADNKQRSMDIINESGLYDVILDSRKPQAKQFRRWVTNEVLPSIRKDGGYVLGQDNMTPEEFATLPRKLCRCRRNEAPLELL